MIVIQDMDTLAKKGSTERQRLVYCTRAALFLSRLVLFEVKCLVFSFLFLVSVQVLIGVDYHCDTYPLPLTFFIMSKEG